MVEYCFANKLCFSRGHWKNDKRQLMTQSRSTSESVTSSGTFLVVLPKKMISMLSPHSRFCCLHDCAALGRRFFSLSIFPVWNICFCMWPREVPTLKSWSSIYRTAPQQISRRGAGDQAAELLLLTLRVYFESTLCRSTITFRDERMNNFTSLICFGKN